MRALVVDDSTAVRDLLVEFLTHLGLQVEHAANGSDALSMAPALPGLSVVLLDWTMPDMDGLEVLRRLRADSRLAGLPVLMLTAESELPRVEQALEAGASEYLMEPFDAQSVLEKLLLLGVDPEGRAAV